MTQSLTFQSGRVAFPREALCSGNILHYQNIPLILLLTLCDLTPAVIITLK